MIRVLLYCLPVFVLIGFVNCGILGGEDKDKSIVWEEESLEGLVVYGFGYQTNSIIKIDPNTGVHELNDDFQTVYSIYSNSSGSKLYISSGEGKPETEHGAVYEVNPTSWESTKLYHRPVEFINSSRDDIYFVTKAVLDTGRFAEFLPDRVFGKIDTKTGNVTEIDTVYMAAANGHDYKAVQIHPSLPIIYIINKKAQLIEFNFENNTKRTLLEHDTVARNPNFTLSPDGHYIYFVGGPVYDVKEEIIVGNIPVFFWGHLAIRSDNKEAYITNNGDLGAFNQPTFRYLNVYSINKNTVIDSIFVGSTTGSIYLSPKERFAFVNKRNIELLVIDLELRKVILEHNYEQILPSSLDRFHLTIKGD